MSDHRPEPVKDVWEGVKLLSQPGSVQPLILRITLPLSVPLLVVRVTHSLSRVLDPLVEMALVQLDVIDGVQMVRLVPFRNLFQAELKLSE